jgi:hypothetical protein
MLQHLAPSGDCVSQRGTKELQTMCLYWVMESLFCVFSHSNLLKNYFLKAGLRTFARANIALNEKIMWSVRMYHIGT